MLPSKTPGSKAPKMRRLRDLLDPTSLRTAEGHANLRPVLGSVKEWSGASRRVPFRAL